MDWPIATLSAGEFPPLLREIPQPPTQLNFRGQLPHPDLPLLAVVGSRKYTSYGKDAIKHLIGGLAGYQLGIVSGLALGIDSLAHQAALDNGLYTLAIPGGGLADSALYPATHKPLAYRILEAGGGLLSEYEPEQRAAEWTFPQRNRLVAGITKATLLVEAAEQSGTLITARMATDYNRDLLVVPGSIFAKNSKGIHQFLKLGATPVTEPSDILEALGIPGATKAGEATPRPPLSPPEAAILTLLHEPLTTDEIIRQSNLDVSQVSILLMQMEMAGYITETGGQYRAIN